MGINHKVTCPKCSNTTEFQIQKPLWQYLRNYEKILIGVTSRLSNGNHVFFADVDKKNLYPHEIRYFWDKAFGPMLSKQLNLFIIETKKGYHLVSLNEFTWISCLRAYNTLLEYNCIDTNFFGYSVARGFATLRLSKKSKNDYFNIRDITLSSRKTSLPHMNLYNNLLRANLEEENTFDKGFELVGYPFRKVKK
jgi:hypothetical protein